MKKPALVFSLLGVFSASTVWAAEPCGLTTIEATIRDTDGDGILECGDGEPRVTREDLGKKSGDAGSTLLAAFLTLADFQLADEESPLRGEWADKCGSLPTVGAFRPQETMVPHLLNAHVRAATSIARSGSPALGGSFDFAVSLGDLADNQQWNETRLFIDILDGGSLVDPDSGADGYDGVQGNEPDGAGGLAERVPGGSVLAVANEPFWASGLRYANGDALVRIPWYSVIGNHDVKVQGTVTDLPGWREFARLWAVGNVKLQDIAPDYQQELCADPSLFGNPAFWLKVLNDPGTTKIVPADPDRRLLDRDEWMAEHSTTAGLPAGHGFGASGERCLDENGVPIPRACYSFSQGDFLYVVLDTSPGEGLENGNLDGPQFRWLERTLAAHSTAYRDESGAPVANPNGVDRLIVVFGHHTISSTSNTGLPLGDFLPAPLPDTVAGILGVHRGDEVRRLLLRFPNVILQASGHTHRNEIWAHQDPSIRPGGYWEINTAAIADYPLQSRTVEIASNGDCTLSIFATVFDALVPPDARSLSWDDDPTDETTLAGAPKKINEDWLASAALEVAYHDPQGDLTAIGTPGDRNVELVIPAPAWFCAP